MKNWKIIGGATLLTVALAIGAAGEAWASHLEDIAARGTIRIGTTGD